MISLRLMTAYRIRIFKYKESAGQRPCHHESHAPLCKGESSCVTVHTEQKKKKKKKKKQPKSQCAWPCSTVRSGFYLLRASKSPRHKLDCPHAVVLPVPLPVCAQRLTETWVPLSRPSKWLFLSDSKVLRRLPRRLTRQGMYWAVDTIAGKMCCSLLLFESSSLSGESLLLPSGRGWR